MKVIKYRIEQSGGSLLETTIGYNESSLEIAKAEAYNGEYTIEDDGMPEPVREATTDEVINALLGVTV